jgi:predicted kinase
MYPSYNEQKLLTLKILYKFVIKDSFGLDIVGIAILISCRSCIGSRSLSGDKMNLIIFSGLPGTGKSTLAEAIGRDLGIPVFAKDWLEATLLRSELKPTKEEKSLGFAGYELLTTLAERQLMLDQSVILDSVAASQAIRRTWRELSEKYGADCRVIECICSDESLHRSRLNSRTRNIPGWHELEWSEIERVKQYYFPWEEERLILDMTKSYDENFTKAKTYCE